MSEEAFAARKRAPRAAEIAVGVIAGTMAITVAGLALLAIHPALTGRTHPGTGIWALIGGVLLFGGFLAVKGLSLVCGTSSRSTTLQSGEVRRWPLLAGVLSLLMPGVGQIYNGEWGKAAGFYFGMLGGVGLVFSGLTGRSFWGLLVTGFAVFAVRIWSIIDAMLVASRSPAVPRHWYTSWFLLVPTGVAMALLPYALQPLQVVKSYYLPSASMKPTIAVGDRLVADLHYFQDHPVKVGDVVIFRLPEDPSEELTKRVVALPGDRVEMRDKVLYVNGKTVREPWVMHTDPLVGRVGARGRRDNLGSVVVPKDAFFALGDNRDESYDSRFYGSVPIDNLVGKPLYIYFSFNFSRIGQPI